MNLLDMLKAHIGEVYDTLSQGKVGEDLRSDAGKIKTGGLARLEQLTAMSPQEAAMSFGPMGITKVAPNIRKALEQGYRMDEPLYHGTNSLDDFERFKVAAQRNDGRRTGGAGSVSLSNSPEFASRYSTAGALPEDEIARKISQYSPNTPPAGPRVLPVVTRGNLWDHENFGHVKLGLDYLESKGLVKNLQNYAFYKDAMKAGDWGVVEKDLGRDFFKENNFTGARVKEGGTSNVIMFDPSAIRSPWAKFNKKDKNSSNLLASGLLGALGLSNLQQEEIK